MNFAEMKQRARYTDCKVVETLVLWDNEAEKHNYLLLFFFSTSTFVS